MNYNREVILYECLKIIGIGQSASKLPYSSFLIGGFMKKPLNRWNDREVDYLKKHFLLMSNKELAEALERSTGEISGKLTQLKLRRKTKETYKDFLIDNYKEKTNLEMAEELQISKSQIVYYLRTYGLKRESKNFNYDRSVWNAQTLGFLKENYLIKSYSEIGEELGISSSAVSSKVNKLGLKKKQVNTTSRPHERWKRYLETNYEVSDLGNIRNLETKHILKPHFHKGYFNVSIQIDGKGVHVRNHRAVAIAFIPNPENKPLVNHKSGNTRDNARTNLEWATESENQIHAQTLEMERDAVDEPIVHKICSYLEIGYSPEQIYKIISKKFNISNSIIYSIKKRKDWKSISRLYDF